MMRLLEHPTRFLFFTGKGGVGKTSLAGAVAVALADAGRRVLLVSTDPASNLGQVFEQPVTDRITPVAAVPGLHVVNVDPEAAAGAYREKTLAPLRPILPPEVLAQMEEQLAGACTLEVATFDEFTRFVADPERTRDFDHLLFDTAPTGHTLRLLKLPAAWTDFIDANPNGASCLGPTAGLALQRERYAATVARLRDPATTTLVLVSRPERTALAEAARSSAELQKLGLKNQYLVLNGCFEARNPDDPIARALEEQARQAVAAMPEALRLLPRESLPLQPFNMVGIAALRALLQDRPAVTPPQPSLPSFSLPDLPSLSTLAENLASKRRGLVLLMGKGGVGKTTLATLLALELARRGHPVHLTTTDPAAHLDDTLGERVENLRVSRIDPAAETARYREHVFATRGKHLDADARALLEEDLRSPCTEEVAVFHAFSRVVREAARSFVVVDTAPTGHTLLLLDTTGAYHREVLRTTRLAPERVTTPMMRLQDPDYTTLLIVTLPETTPVLEAAALQEDLRRAGIEPHGWVINRSLAAAQPVDPLLRSRATLEIPLIRQVQEKHAAHTYLVPFQTHWSSVAGAAWKIHASAADPVA